MADLWSAVLVSALYLATVQRMSREERYHERRPSRWRWSSSFTPPRTGSLPEKTGAELTARHRTYHTPYPGLCYAVVLRAADRSFAINQPQSANEGLSRYGCVGCPVIRQKLHGNMTFRRIFKSSPGCNHQGVLYHREVNPLPDLATRERYSRSQQSITKVMVTISPFRNLNSRPSEHQR